MDFRLEYNEKQGRFHFHLDDGLDENTFGWVTLCKYISDKQAMEFTAIMREKYPSTQPSLESVKIEFENFLLS